MPEDHYGDRYKDLSQSALLVANMASDESAHGDQYYVGVEHLFMGLCRVDDPTLATAMRECQFDSAYWRREVREAATLPYRRQWDPVIFYTPRYDKSLRMARRIMRACNACLVEPAHLMIALLSDRDSLPVRVLEREQFQIELLQRALLGAVRGSSQASPLARETPVLLRFGR